MEASNIKAMYDALEAAHRTLKLVYENAAELIQPHLADEIAHTGSAIEDALAAPPRNCDAGTAVEQAKRLSEWCGARHCSSCQFKGGWPDECKLRWAQMLYEKGGKE